jgi:isoleucyl-tRNA synthetase
VLDHLHRCLATWLAPALVFTAEEAWTARFGEASSVHMQDFPDIPAAWNDPALAARWNRIRDLRRAVTAGLEAARQEGWLKSSLQGSVTLRLPEGDSGLLTAAEWAEISIVSDFVLQSAPDAADQSPAVEVTAAPGEKCARCWRVLPEVGRHAAHPTLCTRCCDAVESGLTYRAAAE